jgi:hypothetical protein
MNRWVAVAIVIVVVASAALLTAVALHRQQVHHDQIEAAQRRFNKLDLAHRTLQAARTRFDSDYKKMDSDYKVAETASDKAHDEFASLSGQEVLALKHTERVKVEALEALQSDIDATDQTWLSALSSLYGEDAVAQVRQHMSDRNEARQDAFSTWWRAAQSGEDNMKDAINGNEPGHSNDEIAHDYDESNKDDAHASQLQLKVDRESFALEHRTNLEWQDAKRTLAALQGGK